jgi:hypothetical protein
VATCCATHFVQTVIASHFEWKARTPERLTGEVWLDAHGEGTATLLAWLGAFPFRLIGSLPCRSAQFSEEDQGNARLEHR